MGKKKVAKKTEQEVLAETEKLESAVAKTVGKSSKRIESGAIYINASYNNTIVTVTDKDGNVLVWASSGSLGFSGPKKATPFAAAKVAETVAEKIQRSGPVNVKMYVRGVGSGRDAAIKAFAGKDINITSIKDMTPIPHNGPRPPKVRRI